jgi:spermidine synthase
MISDKFHPTKIIGVEIDPIMIDLGRRHFALAQIPNLEIINGNAKNIINNLTIKQFDIVLVDLYLGDQLPNFVYSNNFLGQLSKLGKLVIINHLFYDPVKKAQAHDLVKKLESFFSHIEIIRSLTNILLLCSQKTGIINRHV